MRPPSIEVARAGKSINQLQSVNEWVERFSAAWSTVSQLKGSIVGSFGAHKHPAPLSHRFPIPLRARNSL